MALVTKLEVRQGQQLVMTPQLQQAIRLLQLSNVELSSFVESELESNPLLERDEAVRDDHARAAEPRRGENGQNAHGGGSGAGGASLREPRAATPANSSEPEPSGWA